MGKFVILSALLITAMVFADSWDNCSRPIDDFAPAKKSEYEWISRTALELFKMNFTHSEDFVIDEVLDAGHKTKPDSTSAYRVSMFLNTTDPDRMFQRLIAAETKPHAQVAKGFAGFFNGLTDEIKKILLKQMDNMDETMKKVLERAKKLK
ncbi:unnamed protein product [Bursaphelenchus xylophilus]|uniref:(pine wood nematode) hypothetical protein n=1 Tax=Bursaphelenchus xylophilus TaxID=6326 RepID=A0A7I8XIH8_BURXY|nr:unnamed protein product [Bursaphelenchus xylophilus]CAG9078818.1 unnamed protein product [Bursaphelenchus xylophilus]